jgi:hypothetical protein
VERLIQFKLQPGQKDKIKQTAIIAQEENTAKIMHTSVSGYLFVV